MREIEMLKTHLKKHICAVIANSETDGYFSWSKISKELAELEEDRDLLVWCIENDLIGEIDVPGEEAIRGFESWRDALRSAKKLKDERGM